MSDWIVFRAGRGLDGAPLAFDIIRRNGVPALAYRRSWDAAASPPPTGELSFAFRLSVLAGLTPCERRTWRRLLDAWPVETIPRADGVSRAAVYARIRGTRGGGGMVRKNPWVRRWWQTRHQQP